MDHFHVSKWKQQNDGCWPNEAEIGIIWAELNNSSFVIAEECLKISVDTSKFVKKLLLTKITVISLSEGKWKRRKSCASFLQLNIRTHLGFGFNLT